ncbi:MAG TPA: alpha/beta fold hydrolase [Thermoanaerobaculia bacterium]|nr:alpha/beta fold hydrolase [Thermoanaerobaculia bacterium]
MGLVRGGLSATRLEAVTHYAQMVLPAELGRASQARFAHAPAGTAIVFVHGFNGNSLETWNNFPALLCGRPSCVGCDLFFYGYDSLRTAATVSAALLRGFLQRLWNHPAALANALLDPAAARPDGLAYRRLILVAHSLGSVVARQAMIDGLRERPADAWAESSRLVLFAPAHKGADIMPLAVESLTGLPVIGAYLESVFPMLKYRYPVLTDLEPGSATLEQLERQARELLAAGRDQMRAARVVRGELDRIVRQLDFGDDPPAEVVVEKGHSDVCKPSLTYERPLTVVEGAI